MFRYLAERYRSFRRNQQLSQINNYRCKYAFIGVGKHSMENLYPVLLVLGVPIKYVYSRNVRVAAKMASLFPNAIGTSDLNMISDDVAVKGVFICSRPVNHYMLTKFFLAAGKYVFVEKPCATNIMQLRNLIEVDPGSKCMVALNKRFNPLHRQLKNHIEGTFSYTGRYVTGAYPEGDCWTELFIHPLDNVLRLFGPVNKWNILPSNEGTYHLQLRHRSVVGSLELSTSYSWSAFEDSLHIVSKKAILALKYPGEFSITHLPPKIETMPLEKIIGGKQVHMSQNASLAIPGLHNNCVVQQGYADEIRFFVQQVELQQSLTGYGPTGLVDLYQLIEQLKLFPK